LPHARDRCSTTATTCCSCQPTKPGVVLRPFPVIHSISLQADLETRPRCGTAGHSGQDPGDDYERAVRSILWVRVNHHFHSTVRRVLTWRLACRWNIFDNASYRTWIIDDPRIWRIPTTRQGLTTKDEITIGARFPDSARLRTSSGQSDSTSRTRLPTIATVEQVRR